MEGRNRRTFCPRGYSRLQVAIISVLRSPHEALPYWWIARLITENYSFETTEDAVRGVIKRMGRYNLFVRERATHGQLRGNRYAFKNEPCPHITPLFTNMESAMQTSTESGVQSAGIDSPSILEKIDRQKNLSISSEESETQTAVRRLEALTEDDIAFHWPMLSGQGFGTIQIRQILNRLAQVNIGPEKVMQGLTHAEWELETHCMCDKSGNVVSKPANWVFKILAHQGYYPRPEGYRSPQEQAELDSAKEAERLKAAHEARKEARMKAWMVSLTPEERRAILESRNSDIPMPEALSLRLHFQKEIWPQIQSQGNA